MQPRCLAWEESKLGCSRRREKKKCSDQIDFREVDIPEHLYGPWESGSSEQVTSGDYKAVESG
jgi:hypothetical protein